ncbi:MAG TPA: sugar transferase [Ktedonobacterales bacterium]|nr:sugar transferase [Ktedonobacterales bacterium]
MSEEAESISAPARLRPAALATAPAEYTDVQPWQEAARAKGRLGYFLIKRCLDCSLALIALIVLSPVFLVTALLVRLTSPGPAFFRQERVGYGGRRFVMYKFRSMYIESDESLHRAAYKQFLRGERAHGKVDGTVLADTQSAGTAAVKAQPPTGDPRITKVGNLLRRSSLDELPQLLNVLRGDMSLVGPRPPIPYEVEEYEPWHWGRLNTLPGITGYWQVHGRSRVTFERMVQMDLEYIQKQSFWYDLKLLLLTIPAVLNRKGAW